MKIGQFTAVQSWAGELDGVFDVADLKVVLNENSNATLFRKLREFLRAGTLLKVTRGVYATPSASLTTISSRIEPESYISTGTVLAQKALIGSIPARKIQAIKIGRPRIYQCALGTIEHLSIDPKLYFGFVSLNGICFATPEKAFLDVCYYYYKGKRLSFDPASDVNFQSLDFSLISNYLNHYDKRFITFFNRIWRMS
jgi:hypothetical protein